MARLPDEIWRLILEIGIERSRLSYRDLCCISIACRRLYRLANEDSFWSTLLSNDFPSPECPSLPSGSSLTPKSFYKIRFEREREFKLAAHRRAVLNIESQVAICSKHLGDLQHLLVKENEKMRAIMSELANLEKIRRASVALNVWQPEAVRGRQKQIVEQSAIPVEHRINALEMELRVCKKQIEISNKAYKYQKCKLELGKEELTSLKYHPMRDYRLRTGSGGDKLKTKKRRKLKQCNYSDENRIKQLEDSDRLSCIFREQPE